MAPALHLRRQETGDQTFADATLAAHNGDDFLNAGIGIQRLQKAFRRTLGTVGAAAGAIVIAICHDGVTSSFQNCFRPDHYNRIPCFVNHFPAKGAVSKGSPEKKSKITAAVP